MFDNLANVGFMTVREHNLLCSIFTAMLHVQEPVFLQISVV